jgi:hypothetical protein
MAENTLFKNNSFSETECKNCGFTDKGVYCSHCGSSLMKHRISITTLISSIIDFFSNFEDKYFNTFKVLLIRPVQFINTYLAGERDSYYIPFKYFFLNLSINFFVYTYFNMAAINENEFDLAADQMLQLKSDIAFDSLINNYGSFFSLLIIPLYVFISKILFRKDSHNLAERATAVTFLLGQLMLFHALLNLISAVFNPFYAIQKYIIFGAEVFIIFLLSYRFFKASLMEALWKSVAITIFVFMSMKYTLIFTREILRIYYGD